MEVLFMAQATINLRMDAALKKEMEAVCKAMGMNLTTAFTIFAKKVTGERRIPFEVSVPNAETVKAIQEVEQGVDIIGPFHSVDEVMEELNA